MILRRPTVVLLSLCLGGLAACHAPDRQATTTAETAQSVAPAASPLAAADPGGLVSCAADIGQAAADKRAATCQAVSPATHPSCNVANSCAMIEDEIARSCALFDGQGAPMPQCNPPPKSQAAALNVVVRYYSAIDAHDYVTAWRQWGDNGPPNQPLARFQAGFARTRSTRLTFGNLQPAEGAAGSIYQTVPVTIEATLDDGTRQRFTGTYVIRRVNGVDGATPDQLRWHIGSAHLTAAN